MMKKLFIILGMFLIGSCVFAKQYVWTQKAFVIDRDSFTNKLNELIQAGYHIDAFTFDNGGGYAAIVYSDDK